jgi:hypothetical protein
MKPTKDGNRGKRILFVLVLGGIFSMLPVSAQSEAEEQKKHWYIGLEGGYAYNTLYSSTGYRAFTEYKDGDGFTIGLPVRYQFFDWFALQTAFQYIQKNHALVRTGLNDAIHSEWTNSFVEVPLVANFSFGSKNLRGFLNTGGYIGFWADSHIKGAALNVSENAYDLEKIHYESYDEQAPWDDRRDNRFEAGLLAGIGVQYAISACTFYAEGRFNYGLTDLQKDYMLQKVPRINDTITIQAGVLFNSAIFSVFTGGKK